LYTVTLFLHSHLVHLALHSFPTRRSSDLTGSFDRTRELALILSTGSGYTTGKNLSLVVHKPLQQLCIFIINILKSGLGKLTLPRSEEHTSELQSRFDLVCRLLLEKKKKRTRI